MSSVATEADPGLVTYRARPIIRLPLSVTTGFSFIRASGIAARSDRRSEVVPTPPRVRRIRGVSDMDREFVRTACTASRLTRSRTQGFEAPAG